MINFQDIFETRKRPFINAFSICMTVPLIEQSKQSKYSLIKATKFISEVNNVNARFICWMRSKLAIEID